MRSHADDTKATVSWDPPDDGGAPITAYLVSASDGRTMVVSPSHTQAHFRGIPVGTTVTFSIPAENAAGMGPASDRSPPATTRPPLSAPRDVRIHPARQVLVTWRPPEHDGGHPSLRYAVMLEDDRGTVRWVDDDVEQTRLVVEEVDHARRHRAVVRCC